MVAELMARLSDSDLGNSEGISFSTQAEGGHARHIRLEGENHEVVNGAEIIPRQGGGDVAVGAFAIGIGDSRQRRVNPGICPTRANFCLTHGGEVLLHASLVCSAHLLLELTHLCEIGVQHTAFAAQGSALGQFAALRFLEQGGENLAATTHRGQPHAIGSAGERVPCERYLHRSDSRVLRGDLGHLLVE